jgi:hypothetical protein
MIESVRAKPVTILESVDRPSEFEATFESMWLPEPSVTRLINPFVSCQPFLRLDKGCLCPIFGGRDTLLLGSNRFLFCAELPSSLRSFQESFGVLQDLFRHASARQIPQVRRSSPVAIADYLFPACRK